MSMVGNGPVHVSSIGQLRIGCQTVTGPASYTTGGWAITPDKFGLAQLVTVIPQVQDGYVLTYDTSTAKFMVYVTHADGGVLVEAASGADLDAVIWNVVAIGI